MATIQFLTPYNRASYHCTELSADHPLFCVTSNIRNMMSKLAAFFLFKFTPDELPLVYLYQFNFRHVTQNVCWLAETSEVPDSITSELSLMSSFVGFSRVTRPFSSECWTSYFIKSLISSEASYWTSRWRERKSSSTGSTIVGLAVPTIGC